MSRRAKRIVVVAWGVVVVVGGGLTLLLDGAGPVGWDDWGRDGAPAPTACPSPEATEETDARPWPTWAGPRPSASVPGPAQYAPEPMRALCAYRVDD